MEELDYENLLGRIMYSEEFQKLQEKESPVEGYINAAFFAREVANCAKNIALKMNIKYGRSKTKITDDQYCELLAYIKYLGMPAYGKEGRIAFDETIGKTYSQSDINMKLAEKKLRIPLPEEMKEDIRQIEYENINDVTSNPVRTVLIAQDMIEDMKFLTPEETKKMGGVTLALTLTQECSLDENGKIIPGEVYNKITPVLQERRRPINPGKVQKAKEHLEDMMLEGVLKRPAINKQLEEHGEK